MPIKKQIIQLPAGNARRLASAQRVSIATVYNALSGKTNNDNAKQIRKVAIEAFGGVKTSKLIL